MAVIAEMERDLLVERTQVGLARAKAEGKTLGRPPKTTGEQRQEITDLYEKGSSISALSRITSQHHADRETGRRGGQNII